MDRFKIGGLNRNPTPLYSHTRRKSDQYQSRDAYISLIPQVSAVGLQHASKAFYGASILIRNSSIRSHSNELKKKISLDLSKIRANKNSSRKSEYHQKFNYLYQRKLVNEKVSSNPCTDRFFNKEIKNEKDNIKENIKPISRGFGAQKTLNSLEPGPDIELICENKFTKRLLVIEDRLCDFYSRRMQ